MLVIGKRQQLSKEVCTADDLTLDCSSPPEKLTSISSADLDLPLSSSSILPRSAKAKVAVGPLSAIHPKSAQAPDIRHSDHLQSEHFQSTTDTNPQLKPPACSKSSPPEGCCGRPDVQDEQRAADKLVTIKKEIGADEHVQEMWTPAADHTIYDCCSCCCGDLCVDTLKSGATLPVAWLPERLQASGLHGRLLWGASYPIMG